MPRHPMDLTNPFCSFLNELFARISGFEACSSNSWIRATNENRSVYFTVFNMILSNQILRKNRHLVLYIHKAPKCDNLAKNKIPGVNLFNMQEREEPDFRMTELAWWV